MHQLILASNNQHKIDEVSAILTPFGFNVIGLSHAGINEEIPETADTIEGNASLKANYIFKHYGFDCFADDTGLEVEALNNAPGVYSARYAGEQKNSEDNIQKLLAQLEGKPNRNARFKTIIALIIDGKEYLFEGIINGKISSEKRGDKGFGYDPIFIPNGYEKTFAEMTAAEKNNISHRAIAVQKLAEFLKLKK
ncbi:MAG: non-canonical purine NTP diphosphatase [Bacteroidia bacterium]